MSSGGILSQEQRSQLLDAYLPELRYDSQSAFRAVAASTATDNPTNRLARGRTVLAAASGVPVLGLKTLVPPPAEAKPEGDEPQASLTEVEPRPPRGARAPTKRDRIHFGPDHVADARRMQAEDHYRDRVYGRVVECEASVHVQYWLWFYSSLAGAASSPLVDFSRAEEPVGGAWRLVQVDLDRNLTPTRLVLKGETVRARPWADVEKVDGRACVYLAPLTQAAQFTPGVEWREFGWDGSDGAGPSITPTVERFDGWEQWPGRWGTHSSAPQSPGHWKAWDAPDRIVRSPALGWVGRMLLWLIAYWPMYPATRVRPPRELTLAARLEQGEVAVSYQQTDVRAAAMLVTVHRAGEHEVVARTVAQQLEASGQIELAVPDDLDACDVRISALTLSGQRRMFVIRGTTANEPDELERAIMRSVVEEQLREQDMRDFSDEYDVSEQVLAASVLDAGPDVWKPAATDLQAFRDARTAHLRRRHAAEVTAKLARRSAVGAPLIVASIPLLLVALASKSGWLTVGAYSTLTVGVLVVLSAGFYVPSWRAAREALRRIRAQPTPPVDEEIPLARARRTFERALAEKVVAPRMREVINEKTSDRYDESLNFSARGLSELRVPAAEIRTDATARLEKLTEHMRGGSVGIAGPRGVGKSTLIRAYCQPRTPGDRRLTAQLSAPVRYDAREFILTLFAQLCDAVLSGQRGRRERPGVRAPMPWLVALAALAVIALGAAAIANDTTWQRAPMVAAAALVIAISVGIVLRVRWKRYVLPLVALAVAVPLLVEALHLEWGWERYLSGGLGLALLVLGVLAISSARPRPVPAALAGAEDRLRALADRSREDIRFQQSWSEGYSGKFRVPLGAEIGTDRQKSFERRQSTFPELVDDLRAFLATAVVARGEVAVGIDEMDKMESGEAAEQFLNEIKAIFGVEGCYYLVSISENAMSSFERRGVPFRDVFDSSFDEVLMLKPLPLGDAKRLLRGRVLGLAPPFLDLAHCLSGGLGRDLLRVTRRLGLYEGEHRDVGSVTTNVVEGELQRQVDAAIVAARAVGLEPHVSDLQLWLSELGRTAPEAQALRTAAAGIPAGWPPNRPEDPETAARADELERLRLQLAAFTYYLATVADFFGAEVSDRAAHFRNAEDGENTGKSDIDRLARARVAFAVNPQLAVSIVSDFRRERGWGCETVGWRATGVAPAGADDGPP